MDNEGWDEYKILQGKIDKIGEFRFLVRGWAVTLVTAAALANLGADLPAYTILGIIPLVAMFQAMEAHQRIWSQAFARRALTLEAQLRQLTATHGATTDSPQIAGVVLATTHNLRRGPRRQRIALDAHRLFYVVVYAVVVAAAGAKTLWKNPPCEPNMEYFGKQYLEGSPRDAQSRLQSGIHGIDLLLKTRGELNA